MTDRPIIFSGPMVRAMLAGRKTQTRRLAASPLSRAVPGDRLYVRESFGCKLWDPPGTEGGRRPEKGDPLLFMADPGATAQWGAGLPSQGGFVWRPAIHMPRWASRLTLTVSEVRHQRLSEIDWSDAEAEGIERSPDDAEMFRMYGHRADDGQGVWTTSPDLSFRSLWNSLHDKPGERWSDNPAIVALTFTVERRNIDSPHATPGSEER